jgi:hypothetical protein
LQALQAPPRGDPKRLVHNSIFLSFKKPWKDGSIILSEYCARAVSTESLDFAFVADAQPRDIDYFEELLRPRTAKETLSGQGVTPPFMTEREKAGNLMVWFHPHVSEMSGPHGFLHDVVWYNFFGSPYLDLIGKNRLRSAGWARVQEVGNGLACYATEKIDDPDLFDRRMKIKLALQEFYWTQACNREDKRAPVFDFSDQYWNPVVTPSSLPPKEG